MRSIGLTVLLMLFQICGMPPKLASQTGPGLGAASGAAIPGSIVAVKLGASAAELGGLWKFQPGDDPSWARPDFDDSSWKTIDLTPPEGSGDATLGTSGYIPGWTSQGYPSHSGYAWYRLRVSVEGASRSLALKMPAFADDAYQVFVNGQQVGEFGKFREQHVTAYSTLPRAFPLPKSMRNGPMTIAVRMWMDSATPFSSPDAGGMHGPPELGYASVIATQIRMDWDDIAHGVGSGFLELLILAMALVMAATLFWLDPQETAYLWLALVCLVTTLGNVIVLLVNFTTGIGQTSGLILLDVILTPVRIGMWVVFWGYWFRLPRLYTLQKCVWPLVVLLGLSVLMLRPPFFGQVVPVGASAYLVPVQLVLKLVLAALLVLVTYFGFRRQRTEGALAVVAILLAAIANYQHELRLVHVKISFSVLDFAISLGTASTILSILIITILLLRRFINSQRLKEQWKLEIQQAREIQQVLVPARLPAVQGLTIESEYRPAREVGGDFFQVLPGEVAGSALIVLGDVTGKGLQAGMLVALIVGAIRTVAQHTSDPEQILGLLNEELCAREHASATCIILQISPDGEVRMANAGQIPPYWNGAEMEVEGALPLGTISGIGYSVQRFQLQEGDALILMSDGIAEAQNAQGEMYGFERVNALLSRPVSTAEIAAAAQDFGQEDDILVLTIRRETQSVLQAASQPELIPAA